MMVFGPECQPLQHRQLRAGVALELGSLTIDGYASYRFQSSKVFEEVDEDDLDALREAGVKEEEILDADPLRPGDQGPAEKLHRRPVHLPVAKPVEEVDDDGATVVRRKDGEVPVPFFNGLLLGTRFLRR